MPPPAATNDSAPGPVVDLRRVDFRAATIRSHTMTYPLILRALNASAAALAASGRGIRTRTGRTAPPFNAAWIWAAPRACSSGTRAPWASELHCGQDRHLIDGRGNDAGGRSRRPPRCRRSRPNQSTLGCRPRPPGALDRYVRKTMSSSGGAVAWMSYKHVNVLSAFSLCIA